jgi:hypothetical protein
VTSASDLAALAALLADQTRAAMCLALLDGRAWTAGELATHARVAPSTATEHLHRLIDGGLRAEPTTNNGGPSHPRPPTAKGTPTRSATAAPTPSPAPGTPPT